MRNKIAVSLWTIVPLGSATYVSIPSAIFIVIPVGSPLLLSVNHSLQIYAPLDVLMLHADSAAGRRGVGRHSSPFLEPEPGIEEQSQLIVNYINRPYAKSVDIMCVKA